MEKKIIDGKEWVCFSKEEKEQMKKVAVKAKQGQLTQEDLKNLAGGNWATTHSWLFCIKY